MRYIGLGKLRIAGPRSPIHPTGAENRMNDSNSSSNPTSSRVTLKLKGAARKSALDNKPPPVPQPQSKPQVKPGAHWSDEYKRRMQADMDKLTGK